MEKRPVANLLQFGTPPFHAVGRIWLILQMKMSNLKSRHEMMRYLREILLVALALFSVQAWGEARIELVKKGAATQLTVDGKPFIILGGELGNSSASCAADIERIFPKLRRMNLNTALVPVYWDLMEPEEGVYDFTLIDKTIDEARANGLRIVPLWFGAWKNSMSCYAPMWVKTDVKRFPRAVTSEGKPLEIASAFSENVYEADSRAFTALMRHIKEKDPEGTVLMVQIENEIGMLEDARDHSALAEKEYAKGVPAQLMDGLAAGRRTLHPELLRRWKDNGMKRKGSWTEVFGDDIYTDEYFMAWNYAKYVERLAKSAKEILGRPVYVNAAMNSRGRKPGEYPSAGPLAHLKDIWKTAAPNVDLLAPDLYDKGFTDWVAQYHTPDNILFIPEIRRFDGNAAQAFYVIGEHDAIGLSPFSIENGSDSPDAPSVKGYRKLAELLPVLAAHQGTRDMRGLYFDGEDKERVLEDGKLRITASHYFTLPWDPRASDGSEWPAAGGVVIRLAPYEYLVAGSGLVLKFEHETETAGSKARLGEDGFLESGAERRQSSGWGKGKRIGIGSVDEVEILPDGSMRRIRSYNGDESHQGRHVRIGVDDFQTLHVKLYEY